MIYKKVVCFAPHPDDETLGLGGTLLKLKSRKCSVDLVNFTQPVMDFPNRDKYLKNLRKIQKKIKKSYGLNKIYNLNFFSTKIDTYPENHLITEINKILIKGKYDTIFLPFINDVHTDHQIITKSILSCTKSFNNNYVRKILMYETISETNFNFVHSFLPNHFEDITKYLKKKISLAKLYKSEIFSHPHPRSSDSIKSLSILRGSQSGYLSAEGFILVFSKNGN